MLIKMKNKILSSIYNCIIVFLVMTLLISCGLFIRDVAYSAKMYKPNERSMLSSLDYGEYYQLYDKSTSIDVERDKDNENLMEFYHIGRYYENASFYKAYKIEGEDTSKYEKVMQESRENITIYAFALDEIDELFDID